MVELNGTKIKATIWDTAVSAYRVAEGLALPSQGQPAADHLCFFFASSPACFFARAQGQERFRTLTSSYYRGAQGIVLTYDVTRRETFEHINQWLDEVEQYSPSGRKDIVLVLCGNKADLEAERKVSKREGEAWAKQRGMLFIETSAKTRLGISQVFNEMLLKILDNPALLGTAAGPRREGADLTQAEPENQDGCC